MHSAVALSGEVTFIMLFVSVGLLNDEDGALQKFADNVSSNLCLLILQMIRAYIYKWSFDDKITCVDICKV